LYSAQDRIHARLKWEDDHVATLERSPFAGEFKVRYQRGDEAIRWDNGSRHGITAPGEKAGHSEVLDLAVADEAWGLEDSKLEQGLSPTMVTRPQPQLWVVSTAGTHRSAYLRGKVDAGRARVGAGHRSSVAYFEWSAVEGSDPADPATWWATMPALGHTVTEATIAAEFERLDLADFCRAYLNWWPGEIPADWQVIAEADWLALADPSSAAADPGGVLGRRHPRPVGRRHRRRWGPAGRVRPCRGRRPPPRDRVGRRSSGRAGRQVVAVRHRGRRHRPSRVADRAAGGR